MTLPEAEVAFFFAALAQLPPEHRFVFAERVAATLGAHPDPGPGDYDRAIRAALAGLWVPPSIEEKKATPRWHRRAANFDQISKQATAES